ncbi:MAG: hypothetical protein K6T87_18250 [Roseiflexus sp.]|nr:hypothetical protein [Roseiflexus sp.]
MPRLMTGIARHAVPRLMTGIARRSVAAVAPSLRAFAPPRAPVDRTPRRSARRGMAQAALAALLQRIAR